MPQGTSQHILFLLKFLNALANTSRGRDYLLLDSQLILSLVPLLKNERNDTALRQQTVGILQKLSLLRAPQIQLIDLQVIEWLMKVLANQSALSEYTLEYSTALLMNLSLRLPGKIVCEKLRILPLLCGLLGHENLNVRTYINGTLYSILTRKALKAHAKSLKLEKTLKELLSSAEESMKKQIFYVLEQLKSGLDEAGVSEEEREEADSSLEDIENMSFDEDETPYSYDNRYGEELLQNYIFLEAPNSLLNTSRFNPLSNQST